MRTQGWAWLVITLGVLLGLGIAVALAAPPDHQDYADQAKANEFVLQRADGSYYDGDHRVRAYVDEADTSLTKNQYDMGHTAACLCWSPDRSVTRDTQVNIYVIGDSLGDTPDTLLMAGVPFQGVRGLWQASVDDTTLADDAVRAQHIKDGEVGSAEIATGSIGWDELAAAARDSIQIGTLGAGSGTNINKILCGSVTVTDHTGITRQGFAVTGMTSGFKCSLGPVGDRADSSGAAEAVTWYVDPQTDSLIVSTSSVTAVNRTVCYWCWTQ